MTNALVRVLLLAIAVYLVDAFFEENHIITRAAVHGVHHAVAIAGRSGIATGVDFVGTAASADLVFARPTINVVMLRPAVQIVVPIVSVEFVSPGSSKELVVPACPV